MTAIKNKGETTKELILDTALTLFSQRGYSSVSIRDICGQVGIKESTIYYHFKNKQDIFDVLCETFMNATYSIPQEFAAEQAKAITVSDDDFTLVCKSFVNHYLMDKRINKFIRMLILEQNINQQAVDLYHKVLFDDTLLEQQKIFGWLMAIGFLKESELACMVMDYYAPIVYLFHRYLVSGEISETIKTEVNHLLDKHIQFFLRKYKAGNGELK